MKHASYVAETEMRAFVAELEEKPEYNQLNRVMNDIEQENSEPDVTVNILLRDDEEAAVDQQQQQPTTHSPRF